MLIVLTDPPLDVLVDDETVAMETEEPSKPSSRSVTPCSEEAPRSPAGSGGSKGSLKRELEEEESEGEVGEVNVFKNAARLIDGAVMNSDVEVRSPQTFTRVLCKPSNFY